MKFKTGPRFGLAAERQGLVYYLCCNYTRLAPGQQRYIITLCATVGGGWQQALFRAVTTPERLLDIAVESGPVSESTLWRRVRAFYRGFDLALFLRAGGTGEGGLPDEQTGE